MRGYDLDTLCVCGLPKRQHAQGNEQKECKSPTGRFDPVCKCGEPRSAHGSGHVLAGCDGFTIAPSRPPTDRERVEAREVRARLEKELVAARRERDELERKVASLKAYIAVQEKAPAQPPCQRLETDATFRVRVVQAVELATGARLDAAGAAVGVKRFCYDSVAHALNVILGTAHCGGWTDGDSIVDQRHDKRPVTCPDCNAIPF